MKKVAIITRTKNRPLLLPRALESVSSQTFKDFVWVVVNDGGTRENVMEVYKKAKKMEINVIVVHNKNSKGMEAASNIGIKNCESKYLIIHDDDDSWEKDFLKETVEFLESEEGKLYGGVVTLSTKVEEEIDEKNYKILKKSPFNDWLSQIYITDMGKMNSYPPISFLYRRETYNSIGGYDETLPVLGDWDFNLKFLLKADVAVIKKRLANYHHRVNIKTKECYGNTIIHGVNKHQKYDAILRNKYLRQDIEMNRLGLGIITNISREIRDLISKIDTKSLIERVLRRIYSTIFKK